jgi:hypothetical protein
LAEELPGADELDKLYRLDASETEAEPEPEPEDDGDEGEGDTDEGDEELQPHGIPHP